MAVANETGTAAMLGRVEGRSAEQIEVAGSNCDACQRRVGFWVSVDEVVVAEGEENLLKTVKNLGVILDSNLSFENHISNVTKTAFFHLRNIAKLRNMLSVSDAEKLVHAFMTSRLDYCNALLGGCPASSINKLQIVQNAAARVLTRSRKYDHITPILQSLHWLPIKFRISYKILLLAYKALNDLAPAYLTNLLSRYNPTRSLRSQNSGLLVVPRIAKSTKGGRTFSYLAPKLWNSLPDNVRGSDTLSLFKSRLKTHLFSQAFI